MKLTCPGIVDSIRKDFGVLWDCRSVGESLEITTPFSLINHKFLVVYATVRGDKLVISDGGVVSSIFDEWPSERGSADIYTSKDYLLEHYGISIVKPSSEVEFYYKCCYKLEDFSSIVFDLCNFATNLINFHLMPISDDVGEVSSRDSFHKKADEFLQEKYSLLGGEKITKRVPGIDEAYFNAVIEKESSYYLFLYVTGSNHSYFRRSIDRASMNSQIAWMSNVSSRIRATIPVVNDEAPGYRVSKISNHLGVLRNVSRQSYRSWSNRESWGQLLN